MPIRLMLAIATAAAAIAFMICRAARYVFDAASRRCHAAFATLMSLLCLRCR